jgi:hypothetical protein
MLGSAISPISIEPPAAVRRDPVGDQAIRNGAIGIRTAPAMRLRAEYAERSVPQWSVD